MDNTERLITSIDRLSDLLEQFLISGAVGLSVPQNPVLYIDWLYEYMDNYKIEKQSRQTHSENLGRIKKHIEPYFSGKYLHEITGEEIQSFLKGFESTNTRDKVRMLLNASFKKAVALRKITYNPMLTVELKKHQSQSYPPFQPKEQIKVLNALEGSKYKPLFIFLCCTGMRLSEALSIHGRDIDNRRKVIKIPLPDTSTKKHEREIPFLPDLLKGVEIKKDLPLFPMTKNACRLHFSKLFDKLKMPHVIHSCRHTFVSVANHVGIPFKHIQVWVGHKTLAMTTDIYTDIISGKDTLISDYIKRLKKAQKIR